MTKHTTYTITFLVLLGGIIPHMHAQISYLETMKTELEKFPIKMVSSMKTTRSPKVDGKLNDEIWETATKLEGFSNTMPRVAKNQDWQQTTAWVTYDDRYLYFAFSCEEKEMEKVRAECVRYDNPDVLFDDRIEILLDTKHNHKEILRFAFNTNGVGYATTLERPVQYSISTIKGDDRWNTEWRVKTQKEEDRWTAEVAIAIDRIFPLGISPGTTWGFNLVRDRHSWFEHEMRFGHNTKKDRPFRTRDSQQITAYKPVFRSGVRGSLSDSWLEPNQYADLIFEQPLLSVKEVRFHEAYANFYGSIWNKPQFFGDNPVEADIVNQSNSPLNIKVITETLDFEGKLVKQEKKLTLIPRETQTVRTDIPVRNNERVQFFLQILNEKDGSLLYETSYDTRVPPFVEFDLSGVYSSGKDKPTIEVSPVVLPEMLDGATIDLALFQKGKPQALAEDQLVKLNPYDFVPCLKELDIKNLASADYTIQCELKDKEGKVVGKFTQEFTRHNQRPYYGLSAKDTVYSFAGVEGDATVVYFPEGERFVFWEHASYVPWWDLENMAVTYEFMESWGYGTEGCAEPMQDKENRYSKVEIIENTPARVVVLWRYALGDPNYKIIFNEWVHEYYYFYPDGSGVREIQLWANHDGLKHEIMQPQYVFPSGVIPEQMVEDTAASILNLKGDIFVNTLEAPVWEVPDSVYAWDEEIFRMYLKNRKHPYLIWSKREDMIPNALNDGLARGDIKRTMGGHWPLQPMNVDVYSVVGTDRPYHAWYGNVYIFSDITKIPNHWKHLIGLCDSDSERLVHIGKNWLEPPTLSVDTENVSFLDYDENQKAYVLEAQQDVQDLRLTFSGEKEGVAHPVFIVKNLTKDVKSVRIGKRLLDTDSFKSGLASRHNQDELVIWIGEDVPGDIPVIFEFEKTIK